MIWYPIASLSPAFLLALACLVDGPWAYAALIYMTVFVFLIDRWTRLEQGVRDDPAALQMAVWLNRVLALAHLVLLPLGVWRLSQTGVGWGSTLACYVALSLFFGQVSNSNAHELIHARPKSDRRLGALVYTSLLFGHHVSAHLRVHHIHVATPADPNSARRNEHFYRFWLRAWIGSFLAGLEAENRRWRGALWQHPFAWYLGGAAACLTAALALAGWRGLLAYILLAIYAQMQLLLSDYVQHYGLYRKTKPDGTLEPQGPQHSWNASPWYSSAMMLNAPRHSDHHLNATRAFPALRLTPQTMPVLPYSLPVMAALATIPPLWRRVMHPCLRELESTG